MLASVIESEDRERNRRFGLYCGIFVATVPLRIREENLFRMRGEDKEPMWKLRHEIHHMLLVDNIFPN